MTIGRKDLEFMEEVAEYFRGTVDPETMPEGSIRDTAIHFGLTRTKVQKILVTTGDYTSSRIRMIQELRSRGMSVKQIAEELDISPATVSASLPYTATFYGTAEPSAHAQAVRDYRAYEKAQAERQIQKQDKQVKTEERMEQEMSVERTNGLGGSNGPGGSNEPGGSNGPDRMERIDKADEADKAAGDDWRKDLDSRLSFTVTDSRRERMTYEAIRKSGILERSRAALEGSGIEIPHITYDWEAVQKELRNKLRENGSLTKEETLELGDFPGALYDRNVLDLEEMYGEKLPYEPSEMIRLHLELMADFSDREKEIMHQYGAMKGDTISRDILVSDDLPLYALHYVIQRAFGWQNSHLHRFYLSDERIKEFTESTERWMHQVGVIYRSPLMSENAEFWADDYRSGSFKNWLRKKYTGPCVSQCWDEGLIEARDSIGWIDLNREYYVAYGSFGNEEAGPFSCMPVYGRDGRKYDAPEASKYVHKFRVEVKKLRDLPVLLLNRIFMRSPFDLLERLSIGEVLAVRNMHCSDDFQEGDYVSTYQEMLDDDMDDEIDKILEEDLHSPSKQPYVYSFTDELLYQYDFGDNWQIRITGSRNCTDLVESGKITQDMLDKSNIKARVTYRPVLLSRDGEMLIDDVGGARGMVEFIEAINTMRRGERDEKGMTVPQLKNWAKSLGWHKDDSTDYHLI